MPTGRTHVQMEDDVTMELFALFIFVFLLFPFCLRCILRSLLSLLLIALFFLMFSSFFCLSFSRLLFDVPSFIVQSEKLCINSFGRRSNAELFCGHDPPPSLLPFSPTSLGHELPPRARGRSKFTEAQHFQKLLHISSAHVYSVIKSAGFYIP